MISSIAESIFCTSPFWNSIFSALSEDILPASAAFLAVCSTFSVISFIEAESSSTEAACLVVPSASVCEPSDICIVSVITSSEVWESSPIIDLNASLICSNESLISAKSPTYSTFGFAVKSPVAICERTFLISLM